MHLSFDGALAQLARAFDWQSRGREFDSHTLHKNKEALVVRQVLLVLSVVKFRLFFFQFRHLKSVLVVVFGSPCDVFGEWR